MKREAATCNPYVPVPVEVVLVTRETGDVKTFCCEPMDSQVEFDFTPGQFVILSVLGAGECPMSLASSPTDTRWVELTVRNVGRVTSALHHGPPRGSLGMRGPYGNGFNLAALHDRPIVLISGGIGLAPLRSLIRFIRTDPKPFGPLTLLYGVRAPSERLYKDELAVWRESSDIALHEIVEETPEGNWEGPVGVVPDLIEHLGGDCTGAAAIICGPPPMIAPTLHRLERHGFAPTDVQIALEGRMSCGIGKCGHCYVGNKLVCTDGPVFTAAELRELGEVL